MLQDRSGRRIDYLRISVTDRCNLRCIYCMPSEGERLIEYKEILRYEEIIRIVRIASILGVKKIRLTGGEPLRRRDIAYLVKGISAIEGINEIGLTTNGVLLKRHVYFLKEAGLNRINVSLDSLDSLKYREITGGGDIEKVLEGIELAESSGLSPISINMVPVRGINDDEIEAFARLTLEKPWRVRFIELMPIGVRDFWRPERYVSEDEIRRRVETLGRLEPAGLNSGGPARYWRLPGARGVIGFISALSNHFCGECNRLRITSDGKIRPCLFSETEIDLKPVLRGSSDDRELMRLISIAIDCKPSGHGLRPDLRSFDVLSRPMSKIGG
ncbi:MAG: GTP 3',8-cyclase MoaA [Thermodesulfovibrionales bacterium]|nr:GTP 3',8-cyclase MoaA [Thermodesulfovibrionales bacterium]